MRGVYTCRSEGEGRYCYRAGGATCVRVSTVSCWRNKDARVETHEDDTVTADKEHVAIPLDCL